MNPYGTLLRWRRRLYETGRLRSRAAPGPSLSVGNLTWGGTGKTPFVERIAREFLGRRRVAVVSRGYGRRSRGARIVSDGRAIRCGVVESGDEAALHARRLPGAIVVVAEDRVEGARRAAELGADFFVFDDAFQHLALRRDLDVVLLDAEDPLGGGLPPFGRAREEPGALSRADILVLTRCPAERPASDEAVRRWNRRAPLFHSRFRFAGWFGPDGERAAAPPPRTLAFCGIGQPRSFRATLAEAGAAPAAWLEFPDHHFYSARDLRGIEEAARRAGAEALLTTEKDLVRIEPLPALPLFAARIEPEIREEGFSAAIVRLFGEGGIVV